MFSFIHTKENRNVIVILTLHQNSTIDEVTGELRKPEQIASYNTKAGVNVVDKLSRTYSVSRKSKRWPLTLFFSLMNSGAINAMVLANLDWSENF